MKRTKTDTGDYTGKMSEYFAMAASFLPGTLQVHSFHLIPSLTYWPYYIKLCWCSYQIQEGEEWMDDGRILSNLRVTCGHNTCKIATYGKGTIMRSKNLKRWELANMYWSYHNQMGAAMIDYFYTIRGRAIGPVHHKWPSCCQVFNDSLTWLQEGHMCLF